MTSIAWHQNNTIELILLRHGLKSKFVHLFISTLHFPDEKKTDIYKVSFNNNIKTCDV